MPELAPLCSSCTFCFHVFKSTIQSFRVVFLTPDGSQCLQIGDQTVTFEFILGKGKEQSADKDRFIQDLLSGELVSYRI